MSTNPEMTGVLLAGGRSKRMGQDKRFLLLNGVTLFDRARSVLEDLFSEVLIVLAEEGPDLSMGRGKAVFDIIPQCAAAGGLFTGLFHAKCERAFVIACDMPFLNSGVISHMMDWAGSSDVVMGKIGLELQPMHGFYSKKCLPFLEEMIQTKNLRLQNLLHYPSLHVRIFGEEEIKKIDQHCLSFFNLNTPADLEFARKLLSS